jgi:hypothetical protein
MLLCFVVVVVIVLFVVAIFLFVVFFVVGIVFVALVQQFSTWGTRTAQVGKQNFRF